MSDSTTTEAPSEAQPATHAAPAAAAPEAPSPKDERPSTADEPPLTDEELFLVKKRLQFHKTVRSLIKLADLDQPFTLLQIATIAIDDACQSTVEKKTHGEALQVVSDMLKRLSDERVAVKNAADALLEVFEQVSARIKERQARPAQES